MKTAKEYRMQAKEILKGNWGVAIGMTVVYSIIISLLTGTLVGGIILTGAFMVSISIAFINLHRRGSMQFGDIAAGFNVGDFSATIGLYVKTVIFVALWSCLFYIPGIVKLFSYSMGPYILADHPGITGGEAITLSKELMVGKKWKLFCLELSFIGWDLLSILTLGILQLWIVPWKEAAIAAFYEDIKNEVVIPGETVEDAQ